MGAHQLVGGLPAVLGIRHQAEKTAAIRIAGEAHAVPVGVGRGLVGPRHVPAEVHLAPGDRIAALGQQDVLGPQFVGVVGLLRCALEILDGTRVVQQLVVVAHHVEHHEFLAVVGVAPLAQGGHHVGFHGLRPFQVLVDHLEVIVHFLAGHRAAGPIAPEGQGPDKESEKHPRHTQFKSILFHLPYSSFNQLFSQVTPR